MAIAKNNLKTIHVLAPARICLFGDHQDYLGLPVIACAINRQIILIGEPNTNKEFIFNLPDINSKRSFSIYENFENLQAGDFFASALRRLRKCPVPTPLPKISTVARMTFH
jgi:galactokinase